MPPLAISHKKHLSGCLWYRAHACMHPWSYTISLLTQYLTNCLWEFH